MKLVSEYRCPECHEVVAEKYVDTTTEELWCPKCKEWYFYGYLSSEHESGGTMKPQNVTQILKNEYDGTSDYHL